MSAWLLAPLELYLGAVALFYGLMAAGALVARRWPRARGPRQHPPARMAILIAAQDEERVIGEAVRHLLAQRYCGAHRVFVVADRCHDGTARAARVAGATVYERAEGAPSKGAALAWLWTRLEPVVWDAVVLLDADNLAHPDFLAELDELLARGAVVVQGRRVAQNPHDGPASALDGLAEALHHQVLAVGLDRWGLSTTLSGSGVAFLTPCFARLVRQVGTVVEDAEWQLQLHHAGVAIRPAPRAVVFDEKVPDFHAMARQRTRWMHGKLRLWLGGWGPMLRAAGRGERGAWEGLLFLATMIPRSLLLLGLGLGLLLALARVPGWWGIGYWLAALGCFGLYLVVGLTTERLSWRVWLEAPRFLGVMLLASWRAMSRRQVGWQRTPHGKTPGPPIGGPGGGDLD